MGLDQWLYADKAGRKAEEPIELGYWRKVNELQGYFQRHFDLDNMEDCHMSLQDIETIIYDLEHRFDEEFLATDGFFFGNFVMDKEDIYYTLYTFSQALRLKKEGYDIWYHSWY